MLKLFHVLDLTKSGVVVMQLFVCGCVSYSWSVMLCHFYYSQAVVGLLNLGALSSWNSRVTPSVTPTLPG
jgi:hypothetical protein